MTSAPTTATQGDGPLSGLKVLELGSTAAGPFCARLLADFGADVIKIEDIAGDPVRNLGDSFEGRSLYAASILRNKRLVSMDLRQPEIQGIVRKMIPHFDVVVENFRPGTLEKWGLGYLELSAINPRIIFTRISGFGQTGPWRGKPGYGVIGEAVSGLREMIGDPDRPPSRVAIPLTDYIGALYAAFGTMLALQSRTATGKGQIVDTALYEAAFSFMEAAVPTFDKLGKNPMRAGAKLPNSAPNNLYPTGDGRFIHITALADRVFGRLAAAMERPDIALDPKFATQVQRSANEDELEAMIIEWLSHLSLDQADEILANAGVPASRIYRMADVFDSELYRARDMILDMPDDRFGSIKLAGIVPKLSETPGSVFRAGQEAGADTFDVLIGEFGFDRARIMELERQGYVRTSETVPA